MFLDAVTHTHTHTQTHAHTHTVAIHDVSDLPWDKENNHNTVLRPWDGNISYTSVTLHVNDKSVKFFYSPRLCSNPCWATVAAVLALFTWWFIGVRRFSLTGNLTDQIHTDHSKLHTETQKPREKNGYDLTSKMTAWWSQEKCSFIILSIMK